ncbi:MAG: hypothetical protein ACOVP8_12330 [Phycisphaerales bacterium]|jgi:hypothetical protein
MTATQQQILDELLRLLSCQDRWSHTTRQNGEWIHTGKVFVQAHKEFDSRDRLYLRVEVNGVPWEIPLFCHKLLWEAAHPLFEKIVNGAADEADNAILGFLKTAA